MADTKISALTGMTGAETVPTDIIPIVKSSVPQTNKITRGEFFKNVPALTVVDASTVTATSANAALTVTQLGAGNSFVVEDSAGPDATPFVINNSGLVGIGLTTPLVSLDVSGNVFVRGEFFNLQPTPTTKAAAATLTMAEILTDIIQYTGAAASLTAPLATDIVAGLPTSMPDNTAFDFSIINTGSGTATLAGNTGTTLIGSGAVTAGASGRFRLRRTSATSVVIYRLA